MLLSNWLVTKLDISRPAWFVQPPLQAGSTAVEGLTWRYAQVRPFGMDYLRARPPPQEWHRRVSSGLTAGNVEQFSQIIKPSPPSLHGPCVVDVTHEEPRGPGPALSGDHPATRRSIKVGSMGSRSRRARQDAACRRMTGTGPGSPEPCTCRCGPYPVVASSLALISMLSMRCRMLSSCPARHLA